MSEARQLGTIAVVTEAAYAAAEARMAGMMHEAARLSDQIAALDAARRERAAVATAEDAALRAGADLRWEQWVDQRRSALTAALARQRAMIEDERAAVSLALGRKLVAHDLADRLARAQRLARDDGRR